MKPTVWYCTLSSRDVCAALGEKSYHVQFRAVVLARSRPAAARAFVAAGLAANVNATNRSIATYGGTSRNAVELATCQQEGQVYVTSYQRPSSEYLRWPPQPPSDESQPADPPVADASGRLDSAAETPEVESAG